MACEVVVVQHEVLRCGTIGVWLGFNDMLSTFVHVAALPPYHSAAVINRDHQPPLRLTVGGWSVVAVSDAEITTQDFRVESPPANVSQCFVGAFQLVQR